MKLRRLRLEHFKRFREPLMLEGFDEGLNLFAAPNEAGKSTVAEALRAAFFERHRSSAVEHLRPWDEPSASPSVEVDFELEGRLHRLRKSFLKGKRCELRIDGEVPLDATDAEDHLAALLGFKYPGRGATAPEHMGIPGLLWIRQGQSHELADVVRHASDHLRQVLGESLGELAATSGDQLLKRVEAARHELLTPAGGAPRGDYATTLQRQAQSTQELARLDADIAAYQTNVDRLAGLRRDHDRDAQQRPWEAVREQRRQAEQKLVAAQGLSSRQQAEQASLAQWRTQAGALRAQLEGFDRDEAAVTQREQALQRAVDAEGVAAAEAQAWERRQLEAQRHDEQARARLERVRTHVARLELDRSVADHEASITSLGETIARAQAARDAWTAQQAQAEALHLPPAALQRLRDDSASLHEASLRLDAAATSLDIVLEPGCAVRLGEERIVGQARRTLVARSVLQIEGVGRLEITPGGVDLDAQAARRDQLASSVLAQCQQLGVASLAEAEERARQSNERRQEAKANQSLLKGLAPQGVEALEAERAARRTRLDELRAQRASLEASAVASGPDDVDAHEPGASSNDLSSATADAERAATAAQDMTARLAQARLAHGQAQGASATARQELDAAQATVQAPDWAPRRSAARQSLSDAVAQEAASQGRAEALAQELRAVNLGLLQQDVDRLGRSATQLEATHDEQRRAIERLEVELETKGALGLEEQRAELQRELEAAARRTGELARRAAALDHLLALLQDKRAELARRLRAPLQKHLDHYLLILFPGGRLQVGDDLSPGDISRPGPRGEERGSFDALSVGTREQMGIVARLAYADLLREAGRPTLLILDDALVHTDEDRLGQMKRVLYDASQRHQLLIFTCHPAAWRDLGVAARSLAG